ncbi:hypothetical protein LGM58_20230 [Burkholderia contaminans]|uniref:hypothetical protein n=1 Tax=Burkholderia contaminans TaxID=488447 RepID=UPI001CF3C185|nr:hypothetical protein [Burkholderia contaminans]MCA7885514.1 hypothetical protein [Burkholderia contaminans]
MTETQAFTDFTGADLRERFVKHFHVTAAPDRWAGKASIHAAYAAYCARSNVEPETESVFFAGVAALLNDPWACDRHRGVVHLAVDDVPALRPYDGMSPYEEPSFVVLPSGKLPKWSAL